MSQILRRFVDDNVASRVWRSGLVLLLMDYKVLLYKKKVISLHCNTRYYSYEQNFYLNCDNMCDGWR